MAGYGLEVCVAAEQLRVVAYRDHRDQAVRQLTGCLTTLTADPKQLGGAFEIGRTFDTEETSVGASDSRFRARTRSRRTCR
jgi:hypothetical protein